MSFADGRSWASGRTSNLSVDALSREADALRRASLARGQSAGSDDQSDLRSGAPARWSLRRSGADADDAHLFRAPVPGYPLWVWYDATETLIVLTWLTRERPE